MHCWAEKFSQYLRPLAGAVIAARVGKRENLEHDKEMKENDKYYARQAFLFFSCNR